jgi:DNA-binding MarR family transcriptional regulator
MKVGTLTDPNNCTTFRTKQLARYIARLYDAEFAHAGMKSTQYSLLTHVLNRGPMSSGELADRLGVEASTLTRSLRVLQASGYVAVTEGQDARVRVVTLTASGKKAQAKAHIHWLAAQQRLTAVLGVELVLTLHNVMEACTEKLRDFQGSKPG